jgi:hypothetical protein
MVIQDAFEAAVHEHPDGVLTVTVPVPPCEPNEMVEGEIVVVQVGAGAVEEAPQAASTIPRDPNRAAAGSQRASTAHLRGTNSKQAASAD